MAKRPMDKANCEILSVGEPYVNDAGKNRQMLSLYKDNEEIDFENCFGKTALTDDDIGKTMTFALTAGQEGYYGWVDSYTAYEQKPKPAPPRRGQQASPQAPKYANGNKDRLIVTQVVYKAMMEKHGVCDKQVLVRDVEMIMEVGTTEDVPF
jgi:hypothetical protein